jgi:hypothetical protein
MRECGGGQLGLRVRAARAAIVDVAANSRLTSAIKQHRTRFIASKTSADGLRTYPGRVM